MQEEFAAEQQGPSEEYYSDNYSDFYSDIKEEYDTGAYTDGMTTWNCILAVYDRQSFEERQYASSVPDPESCSLIDAEALCSCPFTLNIKTAAVSAE